MRYQAYESPVTLLDLLSSIFRYKWRAALVSIVMLVAALTAILLCPERFQSEAKLFVRLGRGSASMDTATVGQTIAIQESRETEMNSITDLLESRALAEQIVEEVGAERLLTKYAWIEVQLEAAMDGVGNMLAPVIGKMKSGDAQPAAAEDGTQTLTPDQIDQRKRFELAVKEVQGNLKVDSPKKSTTIGVAFRAREPQLARDVVNAVVKKYREMHISANQSEGAVKFFDQQFSEQKEKVRLSEDTLRKTKTENEIVTVRGKQDQLQSEITDVKKMQIETRAELEGTLARMSDLQNSISQLKGEIVSERTSGKAAGASDAMRDRLYELEIREKELASKYVSTDPRLQRVREQLGEARTIIKQQPDAREESVLAINPIRQQLENDLLTARSAAAALKAKENALNGLEGELVTQLSDVNQLEVDSEEMQRRILVARENYLSYAKKLEESRINAALDESALSNVSVVGEPTLQYKHVSPKRSLLAAVGACFSLLCGAAVALVSDYGRNSRELSVIRRAEREAYLRRLQTAQAMADEPSAFNHEKTRLLAGSVAGGAHESEGHSEAATTAAAADDTPEQATDDETPKKAR